MLKVVEVIGVAITGAYEGVASPVTRMKIVRMVRLRSCRMPQDGLCRSRLQYPDRRTTKR
jgi:hypothetical protein